jgi:hypothetical protein
MSKNTFFVMAPGLWALAAMVRTLTRRLLAPARCRTGLLIRLAARCICCTSVCGSGGQRGMRQQQEQGV